MTRFYLRDATAARRRAPLYLVDATDGITAETGEAAGQPQISKNGAAWANTGATLTAVGNGKYYVELTAAELSDLGTISVRYKSANTAEFSRDFPVEVQRFQHTNYDQRITSGTERIRFTLVDAVGLPVTGQAASITGQLSINGGAPTAVAGTFTEVSAANHPGEYYYVMHATEQTTNVDGVLSLYLSSATTAFTTCTVGVEIEIPANITLNGYLVGEQPGNVVITLNEVTPAERRVYMTLTDRDTSSRYTGITGGSFTAIKISKAGAAAVATAGTFVEIDAGDAPGEYYYEATAAEVNTEGVLIIYFQPSDGEPFTLAAQVAIASTDVNVVSISGDTVAADNLEAQFDGTGLTGTTFPARQDAEEIRRNTATAGAAGTITLDGGANATNDYYNRRTIVIVGGTGIGQARFIYDYSGSTKVANVTPNWNTNPDATSVFVILPTAGTHLQTIENSSGQPITLSGSDNGLLPGDLYKWRGATLVDLVFGDSTGLPSADVINAGLAAAGAATTITLGTSTYGLIATSVVDNFYNGVRILIVAGTGAGQERIITAYVGATKVATVDTAWVTNPNSTSRYILLASGRQTAVALGTVDSNVVSMAAGTVTATAIATDAIDSDAIAASAVTEIQSGLATSAALATVQSDTDDIQTRLPAALGANGNMKADVRDHIGTAVATPTVAGVPEVDVTHFVGQLAPTPTATGVPEVDVRRWRNVQPDALIGTKVPVAVMRWLTDDAGGTPNALVANRVDANVGAMSANVMTAAAAAADLTTELQAGLATAAALQVVDDFVDDLETRLTAARAGYLDNLNVGGLVASSAEATAIQNNTRVVRVVPEVIVTPDTSTRTYRIELLLYDDVGNMEAPDSAPTITLVNQTGTDRSARLDSTTMALVSTGRYRTIYTSTAGDTAEQLVWAFSVVEGGATRLYGNTSTVGEEDNGAAAIADAVWDENRAGHVTAGTFGEGVVVSSLLTAARDAIVASIMAYSHDTGLTIKGAFRRMDALKAGKATGLKGAIARFFMRDGTTAAITANQNVRAGTRDAASVTGSES